MYIYVGGEGDGFHGGEEGARCYNRTAVTGHTSHLGSCGFHWELNPGPRVEQEAFLITEASSHPWESVFFKSVTAGGLTMLLCVAHPSNYTGSRNWTW